MKVYQSNYVKCPFYHQENGPKIKCEGFCKSCTIQITFDRKESLQMHREIYCENFDGYPKCPLFPVINKQYEEVKKN
jgi:hypothetical protein